MGIRVLFLAFLGLLVCCFAAARDGLDKAVQHMIGSSCAPGVFSLMGIPAVAGCAGAAVIVVSAVATAFIKPQHDRKILFISFHAA